MLDHLKSIIVVSGVGNTGKTSGIKLAMEKLSIVINPQFPKRDTLFMGRVFIDGKTIFCGIATGGDTEEIVLQNLDFFSQSAMGLQAIVIACKSEGKSKKAVEGFADGFSFAASWILTRWVGNDDGDGVEVERISDEIVEHLRQRSVDQ